MNAGVLALNGDPMSWEPLSPLLLLDRAAAAFAGRPAVVAGAQSLTYGEFRDCSFKLAGAVRGLGAERGDRVAVLAHNTPMLLAAHYAVPAAAAVLVALNTRLKPAELAAILDHAGARLLLCDSELEAPAQAAAAIADTHIRVVVDAGEEGELAKLTMASQPLREQVRDERDLLSLNYTSGTTGDPKGVMYHHRGAFLQSIAMAFHARLGTDTAYLWTLPMFHCNGWCTAWGVTAIGGRHVCLRAVRGDLMWQLIVQEEVTHLNGAPPVLSALVSADEAHPLERRLVITTAGAPPNPNTIARCDGINARVVHVYGLTETYGPYSVCQWQAGWEDLEVKDRAALLSRQGVGMIQAERLRVVDDEMNDVPADGTTMGEIVMRGNNVMKGYFDDQGATDQAFSDGWFHSGDLGVMQPDRYVQLLDRAKDVVVSGGENISTVEIEQAILTHDAVLDAAVIGVPDEKWGERPKAFVVLKPGQAASEQAIIDHVKSTIARYKAPKAVAFLDELPKTSTGKVPKFELREREWAGHTSRIKG